MENKAKHIGQVSLLFGAGLASHCLGSSHGSAEAIASTLGLSTHVAQGIFTLGSDVLAHGVYESLMKAKESFKGDVNYDLETAILNAYKNALSQIEKDIIEEYQVKEKISKKLMRYVFNKKSKEYEDLSELKESFLTPLLESLTSDRIIGEMLQQNQQLAPDEFLRKIIEKTTPEFAEKDNGLFVEFIDNVCEKFKRYFKHYFLHELKTSEKAKTVYYTHLLEGIIVNTRDIHRDFPILFDFAYQTNQQLPLIFEQLENVSSNFKELMKHYYNTQNDNFIKLNSIQNSLDNLLASDTNKFSSPKFLDASDNSEPSLNEEKHRFPRNNTMMTESEIMEYIETVGRKIYLIKTPLLKDDVEIGKTTSISLEALHNENEAEYDKHNDVNTLDYFLKKEGLILVEGDPNSGKTTLLKRYTYFLSSIWKRERNGLIPLRIDLNNCLGVTFEREIVSSLLSNGISIMNISVEKFLQENKFVLLLDGFDEGTGDKSKIINEIKKYSQFVPIIITSRDTEELTFFKSNVKLFILKLSKLSFIEQIRIIIGVLGDMQINRFLSQIKGGRMNGLESNPLYLQLLIQYYKENKGELTNNLFTLYDYIIRNILNWKISFPQPEVFPIPNGYSKLKNEILEELAYKMLNSNQIKFSKKYIDEHIESWLKRNNYSRIGELKLFIYEDFLTSKLLIEEDNKIGFFHRSFMDYFSLSNIEREDRKTIKKRFYFKNSYFVLKLLFSKNQSLEELDRFIPKKRNLFFLDREKAANWIFNFCCCLNSIKSRFDHEKDQTLKLIKFLFEELKKFNLNKTSLSQMGYNVKFCVENLFGSLGELNYEPAKEFYLYYLRENEEYIHYGHLGVEHFNFDLKDTGALLDFYFIGKHSYLFENALETLVLKDSDFVGNTILDRIKNSEDDMVRKELINLILNLYFNWEYFPFIQSKSILEFIVKKLLSEEDRKLQWSLCNKLHSLYLKDKFIDQNKLIHEYREIIIDRVKWAVLQQNDKLVKNNAVRFVGLNIRTDVRFEDLLTLAIEDEDEDILSSCLFINYNFKFKKPENELKYFERAYKIFEMYPFLDYAVIKAMERAKSQLTDKDIYLVFECLKPIDEEKLISAYKELELSEEVIKLAITMVKEIKAVEQEAAFDIIVSRNIGEAKSILEVIIENDKTKGYLFCRSIEAMIYLKPSLYFENYELSFTKQYNELIKSTLEINEIEQFIDEKLKFVGNFETLEILRQINEKYDEDRHTRSLKEQYRTKPLNFIYGDKKTEKETWKIIYYGMRNIKEKLIYVEKKCNIKIL